MPPASTLDAERLFEMAAIYPDEWTFVCDDVFDYARRRYAEGRTYDLVSLDPPTNLFERCADKSSSGARWPGA